MNKKQRDKTLKNSDAMGFLDLITWCLGAAWLIVVIIAASTNQAMSTGMLIAAAAAPIYLALLRIRMLLRAIRVDALLRESEEQTRQ